MSTVNLSHQLREIQLQCQLITDAVADTSREQFDSNIVLKSAVERFIINIGIAAIRIRNAYPDEFDEIEGLRVAISVRNRLAHGYGEDIDDDVIWDIVQSSIPLLLQEIESRL